MEFPPSPVAQESLPNQRREEKPASSPTLEIIEEASQHTEELSVIRQRLGLDRTSTEGNPAKVENDTLQDPDSHIEEANKSLYDFEHLSPALQEAVTVRTEEIYASLPPVTWSVPKIFKLKDGPFSFGNKRATTEQMEYFESYQRLAVQQLVMGEFFGKEEPVQEDAQVLEELRERKLGRPGFGGRKYEGVHVASIFAGGIDVLHDTAHTWVDLAESDNRSTASNMVPKFLRYKQSIGTVEALKDASSHDEDIVALYNIDQFWSRRNVLKAIRESKSREEFIAHDPRIKESLTSTEPTDFKKYVRGRVYDEYASNPNLLFEIFLESTLPAMEKHAPE